MIIAHVCPYYTPAIGGVKQVVEELAKRQISKDNSNANAQFTEGNEVHVFTSDWDKNNRIEVMDEVIDGVNVHRCKHYLKVSSFSTIWPGVYSKLLELKPDVIHAHVTGHLHTYLAKKAAKKLEERCDSGCKFIITTHCPWESKRSLPGTIANFISYKFFPVLKYADAVIAITPWEHKFLKAEGVKPERIHTIPNGMDKSFFNKIEPNMFKEKHNIPEHHKIVLFFGRLNYTKNPQMFIEIADKVLKERNNATFVMCGPDEGELEDVTNKIDSLYPRVKNNFRLLPPNRNRQDIIEMYQASDIYLLPSRREGLPLTIFEAYASGLPVIGSSVNGVSYELKDKVNGFLLPHSDTNSFIKRTNFILDNERLRHQFSINNETKAKDFDWDLINKRTMEVYKK